MRPPERAASSAQPLVRAAGSTVITTRFNPGTFSGHKCGPYNANTPDFCNKCVTQFGLQLK